MFVAAGTHFGLDALVLSGKHCGCRNALEFWNSAVSEAKHERRGGSAKVWKYEGYGNLFSFVSSGVSKGKGRLTWNSMRMCGGSYTCRGIGDLCG